MKKYISLVILICLNNNILSQPNLNLAEPGPFEIVIFSEVIIFDSGVSTDYKIFQPINDTNTTHLILSHGFFRDKSVMEDLAIHYASWGIKTVTMDLLHSSIFDNDPIQDALDLIYLSNIIGSENSVIYGGHSAGGMRSVLAASEDSNTVAVMGLDLVDSDNLALSAASNISIPIWGILGESSECNAFGNGISVYEHAIDGNALQVVEADHCDFESPTNFLCTSICEGTNNQFSNEEIQEVILSLSTAYLLMQTGLNQDGFLWWIPGQEYYEFFIEQGSILQIVNLFIEKKELEFRSKTILFQNYPNPFNPITTINYYLPNKGYVIISFYDIIGNKVDELNSYENNRGLKSIKWNANNNITGMKLPGGVYFYEIKTENFVIRKKLLMLK